MRDFQPPASPFAIGYAILKSVLIAVASVSMTCTMIDFPLTVHTLSCISQDLSNTNQFSQVES